MILSKKTKNNKFQRVLETAHYIYFMDLINDDEETNTKMYDRQMKLLSNNSLSNASLKNDINSGNYVWIENKILSKLNLVHSNI